MDVSIFFTIVLILVILILSILIYISINCLKHTTYVIETNKLPEYTKNLKIVHISDVHSKLFGKNNCKAIQMINEIKPDIVVMTGDIISQYEKNIDGFIEKYRQIYEKYPVFYSIGNHEQKLGHEKYTYYIDKLKKLGVHVIVNGNEKYYTNEDYIVINALEFTEDKTIKKFTDEIKQREIKSMKNKLGHIDNSKYNILLAHDAENFEMYRELGVDLVLSGHVHGGLIRIGKLCLLSPRKRFFPKYSYGINVSNNTTIIASSGMGPSRLHIRLFNRPEIVEININRK